MDLPATLHAGQPSTAGLQVGLSGHAELIVGEEHTAPRVGSGLVHVLATPVMINLFEAAALDAVDQHLPAGYQSLGTILNVRHIAATPVGMKVSALARITRMEGRTVFLSVEARDEKELIGDGLHERVVVNVEKFSQRVQRKLGK
jgi:fluoroacetyl-CoA thioesterase